MIATTPLLGHLAKSGGKLNTPEPTDTRIRVPGVLAPTLEIPFPFFSFYSVAQGALAPVNSWFFSEGVLFNNNDIVDLIVLGPGVWDLNIKHSLDPIGAVSDATSVCSLTYFALDGTGSTVLLSAVKNTFATRHETSWQWRQMVTSDQLYQFRRTNQAGGGLATSASRIQIIATRLF